MNRFVTLMLSTLALLPSLAAAAPVPDVDAMLSYESRTATRSGIVKDTRFQERLIRRDGHIWTERVLPKSVYTEHDLETPAEHAAHEHFDFDSASRLLTRDAAGKLQLDYVDPARTTVVRVPPGEYEATGFGSTWTSAASLIEPASIAAMTKLNKPAPVGATWYEESKGTHYNRVLWSQAKQIALKIESGTRDRSVYRSTTVKLLPLTPTASLPWVNLVKLIQHEYDDFMD